MKFLKLSVAGILISSSPHAYACSIHDQFCTFHGGNQQVTSVNSPGLIDGIHVFYEWDNTSDLDGRLLLPTGFNPYNRLESNNFAQPNYFENVDRTLTSSNPFREVNSRNYAISFFNGQATARINRDTNGGARVPNPRPCAIMGDGAESCEQISVTGIVPDGVYTALISSFGFNGAGTQGNFQVTPVVTGNLAIVYDTHLPRLTLQGTLQNRGDTSYTENPENGYLYLKVRNYNFETPAVGVNHVDITRKVLPDAIAMQQNHFNPHGYYAAAARATLDGALDGHLKLNEAIYYMWHYRGIDGGIAPPIYVDASKLNVVNTEILGLNTVVDFKAKSVFGMQLIPEVPYAAFSITDNVEAAWNPSYDFATHGNVQIDTLTSGKKVIADSSFDYGLYDLTGRSGFNLQVAKKRNKQNEIVRNALELPDEDWVRNGFETRFYNTPKIFNSFSYLDVSQEADSTINSMKKLSAFVEDMDGEAEKKWDFGTIPIYSAASKMPQSISRQTTK